MVELIITVSVAIVVSAACNMCEAALFAVPMRHIEMLVEKKKRSGLILKALRQNIERPITAIASLGTIANTAGAALAGSMATYVLGHHSVGYFSAFFTFSILIFAEVLPKTAGVAYCRFLASLLAYPLQWLVILMTPATWLIGYVTRLVPRGKVKESISSEELKILATLSMRTGGIKPFQKSVIENILTLDSKMVSDVMTPRIVVFSLNEHLTVEEATRKWSGWEHSRYPVYDKDKEDVVGIVLTREIFMALAGGRGQTQLSELMRPVHFVVETARLNNILLEFMESRQKLFVVIDEYGGLSGVITLQDILEEVLGREIMDESDQVADKREMARKQRQKLISRSA